VSNDLRDTAEAVPRTIATIAAMFTPVASSISQVCTHIFGAKMVVAVIPARFGSSRLPGKPLLQLAGRPMVAHVVRAALLAPSVSVVLVATDHEGIAAAARDAGALAVMTDSSLPSGTDRMEAALRLSGIDAPIVVNVQGAWPRR
jgi:CMP-2-keto-3-deoxyoctulosonic acid synthetase